MVKIAYRVDTGKFIFKKCRDKSEHISNTQTKINSAQVARGSQVGTLTNVNMVTIFSKYMIL